MTVIDQTPPGGGDDSVEPVDIQFEMERSFLEYSMSVIVSRALPDVRDGLKPVHRRILYSMWDTSRRPDRPHVKCATVVGDVMARFHPHGDTACSADQNRCLPTLGRAPSQTEGPRGALVYLTIQ